MINKRFISKLPDPKAVDFIWKDQALTLIRDLASNCREYRSIKALRLKILNILAVAILARGKSPEFLKMVNLKKLEGGLDALVYKNIMAAIR